MRAPGLPYYNRTADSDELPPPLSITSSTRRRTLRDYHERCPVDRVGFRQLAGARQPLRIIYQNEVRMFFQLILAGLGLVLMMLGLPSAQGQAPPSQSELSAYVGLHKAAAHGSVDEIRTLLMSKADPNMRDKAGRTPLHVAAFQSRYDAVRALVAGGSNINALENDRYDVITIAAVKDDVRMVKLAIELGGNPAAITSRYDGTALIAASHLGHDTVVQALIDAGAPLNHVNNLGWTALMEAVVLGDGGKRYVATAKALIAAGANKTIADRNGITPLQHAQARHYQGLVAVLE